MVNGSTALADRLRSELVTNPYVGRRNLRFEANEGRVVLRGTVQTFYEKQMAQEVVRRIDGVDQVDNLVEVNWV
jgi:osmotically-inducible protein OsmY